MPIPKIVVTAALTIANMALSASRKIEGPRVDDLGFTAGDYGAPLARIWGLRRQQVPVFWAEDLKEVKRRRKTKGGKFNEYTYYGTWAVAVAGHEVEGVRRIWFDTHLGFDLSGAGPVTPFDFGTTGGGGKGSGGGSGGAGFDDNVAIYLGTADQQPDPRMQATVEAEFGEGSCPAYRDTAYIVFKDVPLEKFGNRIPQVSVEVVGSTETAYPLDEVPAAVTGLGRTRAFSPDYALYLATNPITEEFSIYDVAARAQISSGDGDWESTPYIRSDGTLLARQGSTLAAFDLFGNFQATVYDFGSDPGGLNSVVYDGNGREHWLLGPVFIDGAFHVDQTEYTLPDLMGVTGAIYGLFTDLDGNVWGVGKDGGSSTEAYFHRFVTLDPRLPGQFTVSGLPADSGINDIGPACHFRSDTAEHFVFQWGDDLFAADPVTGSITVSQTSIAQPVFLDASLINLQGGSQTIYVGHEEFDLATLALLRSINLNNWGDFSPNGTGLYDPVNHALITASGGSALQAWLYLDRIGGADVQLRTVIEDVCAVAGIPAPQIDAAACTALVPGYSTGRGSGKDWLEPLLDLYDVDPHPHDFALHFTPRGGTDNVPIDHPDFAQAGEGASLYDMPGTGGSDLPRLVTLNFADLDADQQPALANSGPLGEVDSTRTLKLDMATLALDTDTARQLVARWHRRVWFERNPYGLALTMQRVALEPADIALLGLPDAGGGGGMRQVGARLVSAVLGADRAITTEWRPDDPSLAALDEASGATYDGRRPQRVPVPLISKGFVLDLPLLSDADASATPALYIAAAPLVAGTWPGAGIYENTDGEYSEEFASVPSSGPASWGLSTTALPAADPGVWDRGNSVNVRLQTGTLAGTSEVSIDADPLVNLCLLGGEILNFASATLEGDGSYTLSDLKRGRRGTEQAVDGHASGETFVLLDAAEAQARGVSDVGTALAFKAITAGRTEAGAAVIAVDFTGASLKPYSPVHLEAVKESNGDWTIGWVRRTRIGGAWTSGTTIPLSETSEEYELTVGDGATSATKTVSAATSYTWTVAEQTTDTGAEVAAGSLAFTVVQISDAVGAGFPATAAA